MMPHPGTHLLVNRMFKIMLLLLLLPKRLHQKGPSPRHNRGLLRGAARLCLQDPGILLTELREEE